MADKIGITKAGIDSIVSELNSDHGDIDGYSTTLNKELEFINEKWTGTDATKYTAKMKDDYAVLLKEFNESFQSYIDFLGGVFGEYKRVDDEQAAKEIGV